MPNPQQAELRRSERIPSLTPDASEAALSAEKTPTPTDPRAPVPDEQRPGHDAAHDQDKPDMDAMAERLGVRPPESEQQAPAEDGGQVRGRIRRRQKRTLVAIVVVGSGVAYGVIRRFIRRR